MKARLATGFGLIITVIAWVLLAPVQIGGDTAYVTTRGISMKPMFSTGDLAVLRTADTYEVGDIVAYRSESLKTLVLHRIVEEKNGLFTFKGDNNNWLDGEQLGPDYIVGKLYMRIGQGGRWVEYLTNPIYLGLLTFTLLGVGGSVVHTRRTRRRTRMESSMPSSAPPRLGLAWSPALKSSASFLAGAGLLGVALGAFAFAKPTHTLSTTSATATGTMSFSYTAVVRDSPVYDNNLAEAPEPIFRRLADVVDVKYAYEGDPGTVAVDAELSIKGGWRSVVPLAEPVDFSGDRHEGSVRLDLKALDARVRAATAATGVAPRELEVAVVPRVERRDGTVFRPPLRFTMNTLQLSLVGDTKALLVKESSTDSRPTRKPSTLSFLGLSATIETLRTVSIALVLLALLGAAVLAFLASRSAPMSEGEGIRRRYAAQLVRVHPMPTPPGRPVVDVPEFATLSKIAERYGLLVLYWTRADMDTFVVQDEGTTYRYRASVRSADRERVRAVTDEVTALWRARGHSSGATVTDVPEIAPVEPTAEDVLGLADLTEVPVSATGETAAEVVGTLEDEVDTVVAGLGHFVAEDAVSVDAEPVVVELDYVDVTGEQSEERHPAATVSPPVEPVVADTDGDYAAAAAKFAAAAAEILEAVQGPQPPADVVDQEEDDILPWLPEQRSTSDTDTPVETGEDER